MNVPIKKDNDKKEQDSKKIKYRVCSIHRKGIQW